MLERVPRTQVCVDAALFLSRFWRRRRWGDEQIHLITSLPFRVDAEDHGQGMSERNGREAGEQLCVLRLVPVGRELIRGADDDRVALERQRFGGLEPGSKRLFRELMARAIEDPGPDFRRRERHGMMWITRGGRGSEAI